MGKEIKDIFLHYFSQEFFYELSSIYILTKQAKIIAKVKFDLI